MPNFLLEIGCEEIPAWMIDAAQNDLGLRVGQLLARESLGSPAGVSVFSTPRRLSVMAPVAAAQHDVTEQVIGPSVKVAYKDGGPTPAALAFAKKVGLDVSSLSRIATPKGEYLAAEVTRKGRNAAEILAEHLPQEMASLYWPKNMYWRKPNERFVRPVRWLVAMLDDEIVPMEFHGTVSGNASRGHRLLGDEQVEIPRASAYVEALRNERVLGQQERLQQIRKALDAATRKIPGARWREDASLLDTVVNLTEFASAILGNFDREFLELPEEVLVTVMRDHQKYFAVEDATGKLLPHFLAVLNTDGDASGIIQHGNERVLRARFNDARFFWQTDQKHPLRERTEWLKHVTFQKDLGSYYDKTLRVQRLASWLCELIRDGGVQVRPGVVHKAAYLAKTDLTTELVKEFTELQGIVGGLYARVQQLDSDLPEATRFAIADAIYDQYKPESMEDSVPRTLEGAVLSIADKADSIAGMFALGLQPTGSKDPFALRRQANGIVKIIAEHKLPIGLDRLFECARAAYKGSEAEKKFWGKDALSTKVIMPSGSPSWKYPKSGESVTEEDSLVLSREVFLAERLEFYLRDVLGFKYDVVNAVLAAGAADVVDAVARAEAVAKVRESEDFQSIAIAVKRMKNILRQARAAGYEVPSEFHEAVLRSEAERKLFAAAQQIGGRFRTLRLEKKYDAALAEMAKLRRPIDSFFEKFMVLDEDPVVRSYRLAFLQNFLNSCSAIADFSEIVTEGPK